MTIDTVKEYFNGFLLNLINMCMSIHSNMIGTIDI